MTKQRTLATTANPAVAAESHAVNASTYGYGDGTNAGHLRIGSTLTATTGTANINLANANTWTARQTFNTFTDFLGSAELMTINSGSLTGTTAFDVLTQGVLYYSANATGNFTFNFRGNSGTTLASTLAVAQSVTLTVLCTMGATPYYHTGAPQVDGTTTGVTIKWSTGSAPTAGDASSVNPYTFTIVKTAATPTYTIFATKGLKFA